MLSLRAITLLLTLSAWIALVNASPIQKRSSFKYRAKARGHKHHPHAGSHALRKTYRKFGISFPDFNLPATTTAATSSDAVETGTVEAVPEANDSEFLEKVIIGGQALNLDFDTGSSDLWVFSTELPSSEYSGHTAFNPQKSTTFTDMPDSKWQITYGDGSAASGNAGTDTVNIGGATVTQQVIELATSISQSFAADTDNDGLVGLAFSVLNQVQPQPAKTFFDNIMPSLEKPVFSVDLRGDNSGSYEFGNIDLTKVKGGKLTTVPVDAETGFWQFASGSFAVGGQTQQNSAASPAIADTGTSLLVVDDEVAQAYYSQVQGAENDAQLGGYTFPCNADLPDLSVAMGDSYMATIPGSEISFAPVDQTTCFGAVQGNAGSGMQIFGDTMFKAQYVVFDGKNNALQVGPKA